MPSTGERDKDCRENPTQFGSRDSSERWCHYQENPPSTRKRGGSCFALLSPFPNPHSKNALTLRALPSGPITLSRARPCYLRYSGYGMCLHCRNPSGLFSPLFSHRHTMWLWVLGMFLYGPKPQFFACKTLSINLPQEVWGFAGFFWLKFSAIIYEKCLAQDPKQIKHSTKYSLYYHYC